MPPSSPVDRRNPGRHPAWRYLFFWLVIFGVVVLLWQTISKGAASGLQELTFSQFMEALEKGRIEAVTIRGERLTGRFEDGREEGTDFFTQLPDYPDLIPKLLEADVEITAERSANSPMLAIFLTWGPVLLIVGLWIFFMRAFRR